MLVVMGYNVTMLQCYMFCSNIHCFLRVLFLVCLGLRCVVVLAVTFWKVCNMIPSTQSSGAVVVQLLAVKMLCSGDQAKSSTIFTSSLLDSCYFLLQDKAEPIGCVLATWNDFVSASKHMWPYARSLCSRPYLVHQHLTILDISGVDWILTPCFQKVTSFLPVAESDLAQPVGNHEDVLKFANMMRVNLS